MAVGRGGGASRAGSNHPVLVCTSAAPPSPRRGVLSRTYVAVYRLSISIAECGWWISDLSNSVNNWRPFEKIPDSQRCRCKFESEDSLSIRNLQSQIRNWRGRGSLGSPCLPTVPPKRIAIDHIDHRIPLLFNLRQDTIGPFLFPQQRRFDLSNFSRKSESFLHFNLFLERRLTMKNFFLSGRFLPLSISFLVLSTLNCSEKPRAKRG